MASTAETYRLGTRYPRYTTKLNTFSNGMYLTEQVIPEGYAKALINYDINSTGSNITPRRGRKVTQIMTHNYKNKIWDPLLFDYLYCYDNKEDVVVDTIDTILNPYGEGYIFSKDNDPLTTPKFKYVDRILDESIPEFTINNYLIKAKAFDKDCVDLLRRYTYTVCNNELYAINADAEMEGYDKALNRIVLAKDTDDTTKINSNIKNIIVKDTNAIEATGTGYNLLKEDPYTFKNEKAGAFAMLGVTLSRSIFDGSGQYLYDEHVLSPNVGEPINFNVNYQYAQAGDSIALKVEWLDLTKTTSDWTEVWTFSYTAGQDIIISGFPINVEAVAYRFTAIINGDKTTETTYVKSIQCNNTTIQNYKLINPNILTAKKMVTWYSYVGVYGVEGAPDTIFFSDIENPGYFPFPNNAIQFDNNILAVHNYLDYLLVVTVDSIYLVTIGSTLMTSTQKKIMSNIYIPEIDAMNLVVLKDQIFFKTADQFYVLKPNHYTSDATDLKNYVISTAIDNLTKNFTKETLKLLNATFKTTCFKLTQEYKTRGYDEIHIVDFDVTEIISAVLDSEVHYIYRLYPKFTDGKCGLKDPNNEDVTILPGDVDMHLVYDTVVRSWRIYFVNAGFETYTSTTGEKQPMGSAYKPRYFRDKTTGHYYEIFLVNMPNIVDPNKPSFTAEEYNFIHDAVENAPSNIINITDENRELYYKYLINLNPNDKYNYGCHNDSIGYINQELTTIMFEEMFEQAMTYGNFYIGDRPDVTNNWYNMTYFVEDTYETCSDVFNYGVFYGLAPHYELYTYLDTGIISIDDTFTKRFRELQINLVNMENTMIPFHADFKLDGQEKVSATNFIMNHITDPDDVDYGTIYVTPIESDNFLLYGDTCLANDENEIDHWALDLSRFPELTMVTVRFELKGRGRHASFQLLNDSLKRYELSDMNWVYRTMSAR